MMMTTVESLVAMMPLMILVFVPHEVWSFDVTATRHLTRCGKTTTGCPLTTRRSHAPTSQARGEYTWSPQDLTQDSVGFAPIPDDDYIKRYQRNPKQLWPVEFFLLAYRRVPSRQSNNIRKMETQVLVRKSANGTSKWGLGTGVPVTRWMLSSSQPPQGYKWATSPRIEFEACHYPQFSQHTNDDQMTMTTDSWTYRKIEMCKDAFHKDDDKVLLDPELEEFARKIRNGLREKILMDQQQLNSNNNENLTPWEVTRLDVVKHVLDNPNSVAAIQGTLRMSGLFAHKEEDGDSDDSSLPGSSPRRYVNLDDVDPDKLVQSMRVYTMFPQMPDPMPNPTTTSAEELQEEIATRDTKMVKSGRDPHQDKFGRTYTHKSTSNVSNTIHGIYLTLDVTGLPGLEEVFAVDLFGTQQIPREWKSLQELQVLDDDNMICTTVDPKPNQALQMPFAAAKVKLLKIAFIRLRRVR